MKLLCPLLLASAAASAVISYGPDNESDSLSGGPRTTKPIPGKSPLGTCDLQEDQMLKIQRVDLSPNPPERGKKLTIYARGELLGVVDEGAYVVVDVHMGYIKLFTGVLDLCNELRQGELDFQCPVSPGTYKLQKEVELPHEVPPGKYRVLARAFTADDEEIVCVSGEVYFPPPL